MKVVAVIPARGGSKRLPNKNIRPLCGKPLIAWTIECAIQSQVIDRIIVSTDNADIARISADYGAEVPFLRPGGLAADNVATLPVLQYTINRLREDEDWFPDCVLTLQPTSPLRRPEHIRESITKFKEDPNADSLVSCVKVPHALHPNQIMFIDESGLLRNWVSKKNSLLNEPPGSIAVARNGAAVYLTRTERLSEYILGGRMLAYMMSPEDSIDIDTDFDFRHAEYEMRCRLRGTDAP